MMCSWVKEQANNFLGIYSHFKHTWHIYNTDLTLGQQPSFNTFWRMETIWVIFSDHKVIKLEKKNGN